MLESVDLSRLPAPDVIEALDFEAILTARKDKLGELFPDIADFLNLESEPAVKIQETGAYRELLHYARVNDAARAVMLVHRGDITVSILSAIGDGTPSSGLLDAVRSRLTRDDVKLMTDVISVRAATLAPYGIAVTLRVLKGPDAPLLKAQAKTALEALGRTRRRIGGSVYLTAIAAAAHLSGVEQVVVHAPAADRLGAAHVAPLCGSVTVEAEVVT
jgi:phage-related baseplate assembly protein